MSSLFHVLHRQRRERRPDQQDRRHRAPEREVRRCDGHARDPGDVERDAVGLRQADERRVLAHPLQRQRGHERDSGAGGTHRREPEDRRGDRPGAPPHEQHPAAELAEVLALGGHDRDERAGEGDEDPLCGGQEQGISGRRHGASPLRPSRRTGSRRCVPVTTTCSRSRAPGASRGCAPAVRRR